MIRRGLWLIALLAVCVSMGSVTIGAEGGDMTQVLARLKALEEKNADLESKLKAASGGHSAVDHAVSEANQKMGMVVTAPEPGCNTRPLKIGGYLDTSYQYNFNRPNNINSNQRIFDNDSNGFNVHLAELTFDRLPTEAGQAGFKIDMALGTDPRIFASQDNISTPGARNNQFEVVDLKQAYLEYKLGVGCGCHGNEITIDFGKFVTWMGAETIEAADNMNESRSFLFGDAFPFTHTGVRATYSPFKDVWTVGLGIANANDTIQNPVDSPTGLFMSNWTPVKWFNWTVQGSVGESQYIDERQRFNDATAGATTFANPNAPGLAPDDPTTPGAKSQLTGKKFDPSHGRPRAVLDTVMTFTPFEKFTFVLNADYGTEGAPDEIPGVLTTRNFRRWYGAAAYVKYQFTEKWYVAGRYEYFSDPEGARTGFRQDLQSGTITTDYALSDPLHMRFEYRHDKSNVNAFSSRNNDINNVDALVRAHPWGQDYQDTFSVSWLYKF